MFAQQTSNTCANLPLTNISFAEANGAFTLWSSNFLCLGQGLQNRLCSFSVADPHSMVDNVLMYIEFVFCFNWISHWEAVVRRPNLPLTTFSFAGANGAFTLWSSNFLCLGQGLPNRLRSFKVADPHSMVDNVLINIEFVFCLDRMSHLTSLFLVRFWSNFQYFVCLIFLYLFKSDYFQPGVPL